MSLFIQDPFETDPSYLDEAIFEACQDAEIGGAIFAFASSAGASWVLNDDVFRSFTGRHRFDLIVGVDAVTNEKALKTIESASEHSNNMSTSVFVHDESSSLFHPKLCWFRNSERGRVIVGSGNLTIGGLRNNWEAFSIVDLDLKEFAKIEMRWSNWRHLRKSQLLSTNDPRVIERAAKNTKWIELLGQDDVEGDSDEEEPDVPEESDEAPQGLECLVAEIPRGGNRWTSAGFDKQNYEDFFGAKIGTQRRILLRHVDPDGQLGEIENRPSVQVRSDNYRFELGAAAGLQYPSNMPPIAVFIKTSPRNFRYRLVMPTDSDYRILDALLNQTWDGPETKMRRIRLDATQLHRVWPNSPFWKLSL